VHQQPVLGGAITQAGEHLGGAIELEGLAADLDRVERTGADGVGDGEEVLLTEDEERRRVVGIGCRQVDHRAGGPRHHRIELCHDQPVVVEERPHIGVGETFVAASARVVLAPQRDRREPARSRGLHAFTKAGGRDRARAQHEVVRPQLRHRRYQSCSAIGCARSSAGPKRSSSRRSLA
jgi:hypothetical protein